MYKLILQPLDPNRDYRFGQLKNADEKFINIHINPVNEILWLTVMESKDGGFYYVDVSQDYSNLIGETKDLDDAFRRIIDYFIGKGYKIIDPRE